MTKKTFENLKEKNIYCKSCNKLLPKKYFSYSYVTKDAKASRCKYCDWLIRHGGIPSIPDIDKSILESILQDIIFEKENCLNNIAIKYDMNIDQLIAIIKKLHIGNKKMTIKSNCTNCGQEVNVVLSVYENRENLFCSNECYWKHKKDTALTGKQNKQYRRIQTNCTNCGKEIEIIPYDYNSKNSFGDSHHFCSQQCYWVFRSKYYVGDKCSTYNRIVTEEEKQRMRATVLKTLQKSDRLNSKIQIEVNRLLDKNNIIYEREYPIEFYSIDNYLKDYRLIIEVMGDYWHASPLKYNKEKYLLNGIQYKCIKHDKQKHTYVLNHLGIEILYLWERDIEKYPSKCEALILEYINNKGVLHDYNSFNYSFNNNVLTLNSEIITPYINKTADEIKKILKTSA